MEARVFEKIFGKNLNGQKFSSVWNNLKYYLWKNHVISNDTDLKRSSSHCFQGLNLRHRVTSFGQAFSFTFFFPSKIVFSFLQLKGNNLNTNIKQ